MPQGLGPTSAQSVPKVFRRIKFFPTSGLILEGERAVYYPLALWCGGPQINSEQFVRCGLSSSCLWTRSYARSLRAPAWKNPRTHTRTHAATCSWRLVITCTCTAAGRSRALHQYCSKRHHGACCVLSGAQRATCVVCGAEHMCMCARGMRFARAPGHSRLHAWPHTAHAARTRRRRRGVLDPKPTPKGLSPRATSGKRVLLPVNVVVVERPRRRYRCIR